MSEYRIGGKLVNGVPSFYIKRNGKIVSEGYRSREDATRVAIGLKQREGFSSPVRKNLNRVHSVSRSPLDDIIGSGKAKRKSSYLSSSSKIKIF